MVRGTGNLAAAFALIVVVVAAAVINSSEALELCNINEDGLEACKPSVTEPNPTDPSTECCQALSGADLKCLCSYKNSMFLGSLGISPKLAMVLPAKCNLTPPQNC